MKKLSNDVVRRKQTFGEKFIPVPLNCLPQILQQLARDQTRVYRLWGVGD